MKKMVFVLAAILSVATSALADDRDLKYEIRNLMSDLQSDMRYDWSIEQLVVVRDGLVQILNDLRGGNGGGQSPIICTRQSNSLYYPSDRNGQVKGSTSYNAGYSLIEECKQNLPKPREQVFCAKQGNSLFYPSNVASFQVIGSTSYNAGHSVANDCRATLPRRWDQDLVCYKQGNGLYYPSRALTGEVVGSTSYNAGYPVLSDCWATISQ